MELVSVQQQGGESLAVPEEQIPANRARRRDQQGEIGEKGSNNRGDSTSLSQNRSTASHHCEAAAKRPPQEVPAVTCNPLGAQLSCGQRPFPASAAVLAALPTVSAQRWGNRRLPLRHRGALAGLVALGDLGEDGCKTLAAVTG